MADKACGKHVELASDEHVRITQCPCGTVHLTMIRNGVTLRMNEEAARSLTRGMLRAVDRLDDETAVRVN
jgi:hypothetical protein